MVQLDGSGNVVARFGSIPEAAQATGLDRHNISRAVAVGGKSGGYAWRWAE